MLHPRSRLLDPFRKRFRHVRHTGSRPDAPQAARENRNALTTEDYAPKRFAEWTFSPISRGDLHEVKRSPCCCGFRHYFPAAACRIISRSVFALCAILVQGSMPRRRQERIETPLRQKTMCQSNLPSGTLTVFHEVNRLSCHNSSKCCTPAAVC